MIERETTWSEVTPGVVMRDPNLHYWLVLQEKVVEGMAWLQIANARHQKTAIRRRPDGTPVVLMEASQVEAILLVGERLGGAAILECEDRKTLPERSLKVRINPMPTAGQGAAERRIRSHIELMHEVYAGDGSTRRSVKAWNEMHDEMHAPGPIMIMSWPHHHEKRSTGWTPPTTLD